MRDGLIVEELMTAGVDGLPAMTDGVVVVWLILGAIKAGGLVGDVCSPTRK